MSSRVNAVYVYSCVPYATPIKALHHAHVYQHSGFSVDAGVCIEAHDRAALERLLRPPTVFHGVAAQSG